MKYFLTLFLFVGLKCFGQTSISIAPLVIGKAYFCSYPTDIRFGEIYSEQTNTSVQNPYFSFRAKKFSYRPDIDIGLQVEVSFQKNKHRLGLEWASDGTGTMSKTTYFNSTNTVGADSAFLKPYTTYGNGQGYFQSGFVYNRISLRYHRRVTKENAMFTTYVVPELTMTFGQENSQSWVYEADTVYNNSTYFHNEARSLGSEINTYYFGQTSFLLGIGVRTDIFTLKKHAYLFSIDVSYKQGYKRLVSSSHTEIIHNSGKTVAISNGLVATGSGLYLQISRSFKLKTWGKKE